MKRISYAPLWELIQKKGYSKLEFKDICNFSNETLSKLGKNKEVSLNTILKICVAFNCDIKDVISTPDTNKLQTTNSESHLNTISLFSGAGGLDLGLIKAGFNIVFANDILRPAVQNYEYNIGEISSKDITKISSDELPDGDVVIGGFPCQPFSNAGNRLGTNDDRGNLYLEMIRIINDKKPKVVLMENVRGLLSMKNKDGSLLIDTIVYLLSNAGDGYNVSYKLLKASDYGVPQNRYRVVIVGIRKDYGFTFKFPKPLNIDPEKLTVGYALRGITKDMPNAEDIWNLSPQSLDIISKIPEGGSWKSISYEDLPERLQKIRDNMKKYHSPNFYRRFSRNEINGTITAAATPEKSGIVHPTENRRYSVREIARFQSFPDDYVFVGDSISAKYKVIGNAVPPKLAEVIGKEIIQQLKQHKPAKTVSHDIPLELHF